MTRETIQHDTDTGIHQILKIIGHNMTDTRYKIDRRLT